MLKRSRAALTPQRRAARGKPCLLNVAGVCNYDKDTTILAHFRWLGECGSGYKPADVQAAHACSACNAWTDTPTPAQAKDRAKYESDRNYYAARALVRMRMYDMGKAA
jgi:putative nuclease YbcO-like protein